MYFRMLIMIKWVGHAFSESPCWGRNQVEEAVAVPGYGMPSWRNPHLVPSLSIFRCIFKTRCFRWPFNMTPWPNYDSLWCFDLLGDFHFVAMVAALGIVLDVEKLDKNNKTTTTATTKNNMRRDNILVFHGKPKSKRQCFVSHTRI